MRFSLPNHGSSRGYRGLSYSTAKQLNMYISQKIFMFQGERAVVRMSCFRVSHVRESEQNQPGHIL